MNTTTEQQKLERRDLIPVTAGMVEPGKTVIVERRTFTTNTYELATLQKITGKACIQVIKTASGRTMQFHPDGDYYMSGSRHDFRLLVATEKLLAYVLRQKRLEYLAGMLWHNVPDYLIEQVIRLVEDDEEMLQNVGL